MFDKFIQDIKNMPVTPPILVDMQLANNPNYNVDIFEKTLLHNADLSDDELYSFLKTNYKEVLKSIYEMRDPAYLKYFTTVKFLNTLISVVNQMPITEEIQIYCNKIVYDYITFEGMQSDIASIMIGLSKAVNRESILVLRGIGLSEDNATYIALAAKSSNTDTVNIRRVNFIIATSVSEMWENLDDEDAMFEAEQLIIKIYERTFKKLTILFEATMFDVYDQNAEWMTDKISIMYSLTSMAILRILNSFPYHDIRKVLMSYNLDYTVLTQNNRKPRFSLLNLSSDFNRINYVIESMRAEGIYVM